MDGEDLKKKLGLDGEVKDLPTVVPQGGGLSTAIEAQIENKPQKLRVVRPYFLSAQMIPQNLPGEAQLCLHAFLSCFERQGSVKEGVVRDIVWGFQQWADSPYPEDLTKRGLRQLEKEGYVRFQAPDNLVVNADSSAFDDVWVRYEPRFLELAYIRSA